MTDMMKNVHDSNGSVVSSKEDKQEGKYGETDNRTQLFFMECYERNKTHVRNLVKCLTNVHEKSKIGSKRLGSQHVSKKRVKELCR